MSTPTPATQAPSSIAGPLSLGLAVLAVLSLGWVWLISVESSFDPPEWLRIALSQGLPIGLVGAVVSGAVGVRTSGRGYAVAALVTSALVVVAFGVMYTLLE